MRLKNRQDISAPANLSPAPCLEPGPTAIVRILKIAVNPIRTSVTGALCCDAGILNVKRKNAAFYLGNY